MNIVDKIKRRLIYERDKRSIFKTFKDKGGRLALNTKLSIQGTFSIGRNVVIQNEGIDNITRSQIVVLPGALLEIDDNVGMTQISITCKNYILRAPMKTSSSITTGAFFAVRRSCS